MFVVLLHLDATNHGSFAGLALIAHQVRHAVYFDSKARKVVTEAHDGPLEQFKYAHAPDM